LNHIFFKEVSENEKKLRVGWVIGLFLLPLAICILFGFILSILISEPGDRGTFGDMFGAINTLFSGLAFAGIIYTIYQQGTELKLQRIEVAKTNQQLEDQAKTMNIQRFENTFFQLTAMHQEIVNNVRKGSYNSYEGRAYIASLSSKSISMASRDGHGLKTITSARSHLLNFLETEAVTGISYYDHIANVINFVNDSLFLSQKEKVQYIKFYKAMISPAEMKSVFLYFSQDSLMLPVFEQLKFIIPSEARQVFVEDAQRN